MSVGCIGYATSRGLGHLARDFYKHGVITDFLVVEHPGVPTNHDWYPNSPKTTLRNPDVNLMREFCRGMDAVLFFETPFVWSLMLDCKDWGVRSYLVTMYECTHTHHHPPHMYLCPSLLDWDFFGEGAIPPMFRQYHGTHGSGAKAALVQLPVEYPWRKREKALHFIHNGGYLGLKGSDGYTREGTGYLIEAMQYVRSPIRLTIRVQENVSNHLQSLCAKDSRIEYLPQAVPYGELYGAGDVCIGAQKWNGCSLPLMEAFASGMLVINTDRYPMNTWLPRGPLIQPERTVRHRIGGAYMEFDESIINPRAIAAQIDSWYGRHIGEYSEMGRAWAEDNSWEKLLPKWMEVLQS